MVAASDRAVLGKIAAGVRAAVDARARSGAPADTRRVTLASGTGWDVADVICTAGPRDRVFEEQHSGASIAVVVAGSFQYRTSRGLHLMTPGSFFLGNIGECYECGHQHAAGDRCVAFSFTPTFMDGLAKSLGCSAPFGASRLPPRRESSSIVASIATALACDGRISWEETALDVAATALQASHDGPRARAALDRDALQRVTHVVRAIERDPSADRDLGTLAANAALSAFQFLRSFRRLTGTTPHQYLLRARLRESAASLRASERKVAEIALDCGFNDLSNFNQAFRAEFGVSPRAYRAAHSPSRSKLCDARPLRPEDEFASLR